MAGPLESALASASASPSASPPGTDDGGWRRVGLVAALLLVGSLVPVPLGRRPGFGRVGPDKLLHLVGYAGLAAALAGALEEEGWAGAGPLAVGLATGYGLVVGRLQRRVPGREDEPADQVAGALGAVLGVAVRAARSGPSRRG
jgi:VanZ family protein